MVAIDKLYTELGWFKHSERRKLHKLFLQLNFDGSNIFGTIENCSRHGWFEPLRVNYGAKPGSKWR